jgi:hypothetical protein
MGLRGASMAKMIDYEKLILAQNLAKKIWDKTKLPIWIYHKWCPEGEVLILDTYEHGEFTFKNVDGLINKLKELTKPEPKYKVGDIVYLLGGDDNPIHSFKIDKIINDHGDYWYVRYIDYKGGEFDQWREDVLYPSREALIQSQIEYWQSLAADCEHVSDGRLYGATEWGVTGHYKCVNCGMFY